MLAQLNDFIWTYILVAALLGMGAVLTVATGFFQVRHFGRMFRVLAGAFRHDADHISSFQAMVISVAGRVGAGNIAGVAVAISLGGPGAVFWMWIVALIGMATSCFECSLAQVFKTAEPDGTYRGGPSFYILRGLGRKWKWLAALFSVLMMATFGLGIIPLQSFVLASSVKDAFGVAEAISGVSVAVVMGIVIFGGIKRIAQFAELVVPVMALGYIGISLVVLTINLDELPGIFLYICRSAFGFEEMASGGLVGAILHGVRRGLFSNEAGLGSAPNVAAVAHVPHPVNQGIVQAFSVFVDTIVICSCTAAIILLSDVYQPGSHVEDGAVLTQRALAEHVGSWGGYLVSAALILFVMTTILYCYYLGENALAFFTEAPIAINAFRVLVVGLVFWGAVQDLNTVFDFSDLTMGLTAIVNLFALAMLFKVGLRVLRDFDNQLRDGVKQPIFDPARFADLDIDPKAWKSEPMDR